MNLAKKFGMIAIAVACFAMTAVAAEIPSEPKDSPLLTQYTELRAELLKEMAKRNQRDLRDLQASFTEVNEAIGSMEAFLAAYAIYRGSLNESAVTAEQVASLTLALLSGNSVTTEGVAIPTYSPSVGYKGRVLSPDEALESMQKAMRRVSTVEKRMQKARKRLLKDFSNESSAVQDLNRVLGNVEKMRVLIAQLRTELDARVFGVREEISRNEVESAKVLRKLEAGTVRLLQSKRLIWESQQILSGQAAPDAFDPKPEETDPSSYSNGG